MRRETDSMEPFEGYRRARQGWSWWSVIPGLILALWIVLAFVAMPAAVRGGLWALWFAVAGWGTFRVEGARWLRWGTGHLSRDAVTWEGDDPFTGPLVSRWELGPIANGWGPRIIYPLLVAAFLWSGRTGPALGQPLIQAVGALAVMLAWQSWVRPVYRMVLTVRTEAGRRRIYVVRTGAARNAGE